MYEGKYRRCMGVSKTSMVHCVNGTYLIQYQRLVLPKVKTLWVCIEEIHCTGNEPVIWESYIPCLCLNLRFFVWTRVLVLIHHLILCQQYKVKPFNYGFDLSIHRYSHAIYFTTHLNIKTPSAACYQLVATKSWWNLLCSYIGLILKLFTTTLHQYLSNLVPRH